MQAFSLLECMDDPYPYQGGPHKDIPHQQKSNTLSKHSEEGNFRFCQSMIVDFEKIAL